MSCNARLNKVKKEFEKQNNAGKSVRIKVSRWSKEDDFERQYALYQAKARLGMLGLNEKPKRIWAATEEMKERYADLSEEQAREILKNHGGENVKD